MSKFFCPEVFAGLRADTNGGYKPCCVFKGTIGSTEQYSPIEVMHTDASKRLREAFINQDMNYIENHCQSCLDLENKGLKSRRLEAIENYDKGKYKDKNPQLQQAIEEPGSFFHSVELPSRTGNYCNLKCAMCQPLCSSSYAKEVDQLKDTSPYDQQIFSHIRELVTNKKMDPFKWTWKHSENFDNDVEKILHNLVEFKFSGGEPLAAKWNYDILLKAIELDKAKDIILQFNTNCTLTSPVKASKKVSIFEIVKHFKNVQINVSIEGWGNKNDYIRYPSDFNVVLDNARRFASMNNVDVTFVSTVNAINIADLGEIYKNSSKYPEFKPAVAVNYVDEADFSFMHINAIPDDVRELYLDRMYSYPSEISSYISPYVEMLENRKYNEDMKEKMLSRIVARDKLRGQCLLDCWPEWSEHYEDFLRKNW